MSGYKLLNEHHDHFVIHDIKDGRTFRVPKNGLGSSTLKKIQAFHGGGLAEAEPERSPASALPAWSPTPAYEPANPGFQVPNVADIIADSSMPISKTPEAKAIEEKRDLYNSALKGTTDINIAGRKSFGPNGEEPQEFDTTLWKSVEDKYAGKKSDQTGEAERISALNTQRQAAGLSPLAMPKSPVAAPGGPSPVMPDHGLQQITGSGPAGPGDDMAAMLNKMGGGGGAYKLASALGEEGKQKQAALDSWLEESKRHEADFQAHVKAVDDDTEKLKNDIATAKIDPMRVWNNASTGNRILAGLSLIIGGAAGGATGKNAAWDAIEYTINKDIEAQKANIDSKNTLLHYNMQRYQNLHTAETATRLQMQATLAGQLQAIAAKNQGNIAGAQAAMQAQQIQMSLMPMKMELAKLQFQQKLLNDDGASPEAKIRFAVPEHDQNETLKDLKSAGDMAKVRDNLMDAFNQTADLDTVGNRALHLGFTPSKVNALREPLLASLVKDTEGRITPQDTEMIRKLFVSPGDLESTVALKRRQMAKFLSDKMYYPRLNMYKIRVPMGQYDEHGRNLIQVGAPMITGR